MALNILQNRLNFQKYLLVQISETMKGKARQANFGIGGLIGSQVSKGLSALKDKVVGAFDNAAQDKVKNAVGVVLQPSPSNIPGTIKTGGSGNSNGNMG